MKDKNMNMGESLHSTSKRWYSSVEVKKKRGPIGSQLTYDPITFYLHYRKITKIATLWPIQKKEHKYNY